MGGRTQSPQIRQLPWRRAAKDVISRLNTKDGAPLYLIEAPEGGYRLTPYDPSFEEKMAKAEDIISRYRNTLNVLAQ